MSTSGLDLIKELPKEAAEIVRDFRKAVSATNGKAMLSEREKSKHIETLRPEAQDQIAELRGDGQLAQKRIVSNAGKATKNTSADVQLLSEAKKDKAWSRVQRTLDSSLKNGYAGPDSLHLIRDAVDKAVRNGDADAFAALSEELPSYLNTNGLEAYADILPVLLKPGEALTRTPQARSADRNVSDGWKRVETALSQAEHAVTHTDPSSARDGSVPIDLEYVIPDYEDGEIVTIEAVKPTTVETDEFGKPRQTTDLPQLQEA